MAQRARPRPRLVSRQPAASGEAHAANAANDEDDLFRRNRGRTAQHWKQLEQSAAKAIPFTGSDGDWDPDDSEGGSSPRPRKKKKPVKQNDRPRWQDTNVARILSSDNEDDDIQIIERTSRNPQENTSPSKRKRERSRSRSITPPPALPAHLRANAMNLVRQALAIQPRPPSPSFVDDSTDTIDLDPELAKIAEAARQQVKRAHTDPERAGGPEAVNIKVRWRPHPLNRSAQEQCWSFKMRRHDTFRELFDEVADLAGVMADHLMISHDHRHVFASGTPHSLHMWAEGELEACDKVTAEYIRAQKSNWAPSRQDGPSRHSPSVAPPSDAESEADSAGGDTIKLVLRSAATKDKTFPLIVRSTTTCGAIIKAFLKAAGLPDNYSVTSTSGLGKKSASFPHLMVDGDKMNSEAEIGNADLEDGDLIEIVGV